MYDVMSPLNTAAAIFIQRSPPGWLQYAITQTCEDKNKSSVKSPQPFILVSGASIPLKILSAGDPYNEPGLSRCFAAKHGCTTFTNRCLVTIILSSSSSTSIVVFSLRSRPQAAGWIFGGGTNGPSGTTCAPPPAPPLFFFFFACLGISRRWSWLYLVNMDLSSAPACSSNSFRASRLLAISHKRRRRALLTAIWARSSL